MKTIHDFIRDHKIRISCKRTDRNPHMEGSDMDHWKCSLSRPGGKRMLVVFSMGYGHHGAEPTAADVLNALASDASGYENDKDFESWASNYGYDTDSRKVHKIFNAVKASAAKLKKFIGADYEDLLFNTGSL